MTVQQRKIKKPGSSPNHGQTVLLKKLIFSTKFLTKKVTISVEKMIFRRSSQPKGAIEIKQVGNMFRRNIPFCPTVSTEKGCRQNQVLTESRWKSLHPMAKRSVGSICLIFKKKSEKFKVPSEFTGFPLEICQKSVAHSRKIRRNFKIFFLKMGTLSQPKTIIYTKPANSIFTTTTRDTSIRTT